MRSFQDENLEMKRFDISTPIGILVACSLIFVAMSINSSFLSFIDFRSVLIVVLGTLFVTMASFTFLDIVNTAKIALKSMFYGAIDTNNLVKTVLEISNVARKQGFLNLQAYQKLFSQYPVLAQGLNMYVDNAKTEEVESVTKQYIDSRLNLSDKSISVVRKASEVAPSMGLIGTLIGLVQMLGNLENPSSIGPAMAVALLTTLYGSFISFVILNPLASKIEYGRNNYYIVGNICLTSLISIGNKENPANLEVLLNSILASQQGK